MLPAMLCLLWEGSASFWFLVLLVVGLGGGPLLFYKGFRLLRFKRLILDTPLSRIHSASIGLVEVTGTPVGPYVLTAPITGDRCYYYRVRAWQWVESDNKREWKSVLDESLQVPFFLEDSTGRVLVDPQGAELEVHRSFSDEVNASLFHSPELIPPQLYKFLVTHGLVPYERMKLEERTIPEGYPLFVFGTLGENPQRSSSLSAAPALARASAAKSAFGEFETHPSVAISKGERNEPFSICSFSQKELVGKLAWKSTALIWGGPVLTLAALYLLMLYSNWFH